MIVMDLMPVVTSRDKDNKDPIERRPRLVLNPAQSGRNVADVAPGYYYTNTSSGIITLHIDTFEYLFFNWILV